MTCILFYFITSFFVFCLFILLVFFLFFSSSYCWDFDVRILILNILDLDQARPGWKSTSVFSTLFFYSINTCLTWSKPLPPCLSPSKSGAVCSFSWLRLGLVRPCSHHHLYLSEKKIANEAAVVITGCCVSIPPWCDLMWCDDWIWDGMRWVDINHSTYLTWPYYSMAIEAR